MPKPLLINQNTDEEIWAMFQIAAQAGYSSSIVSKDGSLLDMANWEGNKIKGELMGKRWHEYVNPPDLPKLLAWIADEKVTEPFCFWGASPEPNKPERHYVALTKRCGPNLRLTIGTLEKVAIPPIDHLPAPRVIIG